MGWKCIEPEKLYQKDANIKKEDVQILQEWLKKQPHLPAIEESQIIIFLYGCYYRVEAAKSVIDNYFTIRTHCPNLFSPLTDEEIKVTLSTSLVTVLPKITPDKYKVCMVKFLDSKIENFNCNHLINVINMVTSMHVHSNVFENGSAVVFDMAGFSFGHFARLNLTAIRHGLYYVQDCAPFRIKQIHVVNVTPLIDKVIAILKPFLKTELYNMIQLHPTAEPLYKFVPRECLPEEYGGLLPNCEILSEEILKYTFENHEFLKWHESQTVDERKRVGKSSAADEVFGAEGTFKKLAID